MRHPVSDDGGSNADGRGKPGGMIERVGRLRPTATSIAFSAAFLAFSGQAVASPVLVCDDRDKILEAFEQKHGEKPAGWLVVDGQLIEILISPSGTWTTIKTLPNKRSCLLDAGQGARLPARGEVT